MTDTPSDWQADFVVYDSKGRIAAIAEAKKRAGASPTWARQWYRNYLAHQHGVTLPFVLLVTPETLYLWKPTGDELRQEPSDAADARSVFTHYLDRSKLNANELTGQTFEFLVGTWLNDLTHCVWRPSEPEQQRVLEGSGFLDAVRDGRVVSDLAA
jgi:hypothetical protein